MNTEITRSHLEQFRQDVYEHFNNRADTLMDLVDALSSNTTAQSVVELSLNPHFRRGYSSLFYGIADYLRPGQAEERRGEEQKVLDLIGPHLPPPQRRGFWLLGVDVTPWPRQFADTLTDRSYVYAPNAVGGNKPITIGHQSSLLAVLPEKQAARDAAWIVPLNLRRITTTEDKELVGAEQVDMLMADMRLPFRDQLSVQVGDTAYSKPAYLHAAGKHPHLVTIARVRSNRAFYQRPTLEEKAQPRAGHPTWFGERFVLGDPATWHEADQELTSSYVSQSQRHYRVEMQAWLDMRMPGERHIPMHQHPFTLVRIRLLDEEGKPVFRRPLWLLVCGRRRAELSLLQINDAYQQRTDLEHFFRFGKQRLLFTHFQTPEVQREENWGQLVLLAYLQLWLACPLAEHQPRPWERYLPTMKARIATPSMVQRDFGRIIREIGTPATPPKPRNNSAGRALGTQLPPRPRQPVVKKGKKPP